MAEWSMAVVLNPLYPEGYRGFESLSLAPLSPAPRFDRFRHVLRARTLKPLVKDPFRRKIARLGFDAYTSSVVYFNVTLRSACLGRIGFAQYRYLFDRTDNYKRDIKQIVAALKAETNERLTILAIAGEPTPVESADHRFVQLADVSGYFLTRYRQLEVKTFKPRDSLLKHRAEIEEVYEVLKPKILSFVKQVRNGYVAVNTPPVTWPLISNGWPDTVP
jgi:hypothetical protein